MFKRGTKRILAGVVIPSDYFVFSSLRTIFNWNSLHLIVEFILVISKKNFFIWQILLTVWKNNPLALKTNWEDSTLITFIVSPAYLWVSNLRIQPKTAKKIFREKNNNNEKIVPVLNMYRFFSCYYSLNSTI